MNHLHLFYTFDALPFTEMMDIYIEGNVENGEYFFPEKPKAQQLQLAIQKFRDYLEDDFFPRENAFCALWMEDGQYVSALRLKPWEDGLLLEALETRPDQRKRGCAVKLINAVLREISSQKVYAHVSKSNAASLRTLQSVVSRFSEMQMTAPRITASTSCSARYK